MLAIRASRKDMGTLELDGFVPGKPCHASRVKEMENTLNLEAEGGVGMAGGIRTQSSKTPWSLEKPNLECSPRKEGCFTHICKWTI